MSKEILELYRKLSYENKKKLVREIDYILNVHNKNIIIEIHKELTKMLTK